jgi:hypothetical protein
MQRHCLQSGLLIVILTAAVQSQTRTTADAPQRTIFTTPPSVHSDAAPPPAPAAAAPDSSDSALEKYRDMWRKMTPAQQKAFLDSGGYTPDQYERLLKPKGSTPANGAAAPRNVDSMMDSLNKSIQNLDTVRDANLGRVQRESCPPEVAARIADLKAKLQIYESGGVALPVASRPAIPNEPADPLVIVNDWYKPAAAPVRDRSAQQGKLLAEVLPSGMSAPKPQVSEQEIARTKAELEQLSGACAAPVR